MGYIPVVYSSQMGTDGGSVWALAERDRGRFQIQDNRQKIHNFENFDMKSTKYMIKPAKPDCWEEPRLIKQVSMHEAVLHLRPFFFFFFFFFFPAEFSPSSPSTAEKRLLLHQWHRLQYLTWGIIAVRRSNHLPPRPPLFLCRLSPASPVAWSLQTLRQPLPRRLQHHKPRQ